jgi:hypothetical protein
MGPSRPRMGPPARPPSNAAIIIPLPPFLEESPPAAAEMQPLEMGYNDNHNDYNSNDYNNYVKLQQYTIL